MSVNFPGSIDTTTTLLNPFNRYRWSSRLKTLIAEGETVLTLTDLSDIPADVANNYIGIDDEIMFVTSIDNTGSDKKITVTRAQGSSIAAPHSAGVEVLQVYTAEYHKKLVEAIIAVEEYTKSGDILLDNLTQITTRNHNDLQNLNAPSAHPSASIDNTATTYGRGLATTDNTVQKVADRVNQNGTPAFKTDKSKCSLMLPFKDGLADSTNAITPIGYNTAVKNKADNYISNPDASISATLKQFEGDEGKFGSGVAVEESRTNLFIYSANVTIGGWFCDNGIISLDSVLPDGRNMYKVTANGGAQISVRQLVNLIAGVTYTVSCYTKSTTNLQMGTNGQFSNYFQNNNLKRQHYSFTAPTTDAHNVIIAFSAANLNAGDTIYFSSPQLEVGAFPTSYIATGASAVTRPAGKIQFNKKIEDSAGSISFQYKPDYKHNDFHNRADCPIIFEYGNTARDNYLNLVYFGRSLDTTDEYKFCIINNSNRIYSVAYTATNFDDKIFNFIVKWSANIFSFYINGALIGTCNKDAFDVNSLLYLGNISGLATYLGNGTISNFEIFNYALSADEISNINNAGLEGKPVELSNGKTVSEADRLSPNINAGSNKAQFVTDKSKCSLLLDFAGTLADRTAGINPIGTDAVNKWTDNYVNDSTSKEAATNISCTFKSFEGDEGKFGSGVAVEESRTNLLLQSDDLTSATWTKINCTVTLDRILPDGRKLFKVVATVSDTAFIVQGITGTAVSHTWSIYGYSGGAVGEFRAINNGVYAGALLTPNTSKMTRASITATAATGIGSYGFAINATIGDVYYITSPQLEAGAFPTSYIATGATAVTRPVGHLNYTSKISSVGSLSAWMKHKTLPANSQMMPAGFYTASDQLADAFIIFGSNGGTWSFYNGGGTATSFSYTLPVNEWYNIIMTWDGSTISLYINKELVATATQGPNFDKFVKQNFRPTGVSFKLSNYVDFNYVLSTDEIAQIYNSGLEGKPIVTTSPQTIIPVGQTLYDPLYVTFASGWGISTTYPNKPMMSNHDNIALLRGIVEYSGVINSDVTLFTLPVGSRPSLPDTYFNSFIVPSRDSGAPSARILRVYGNGDVVLMANGATITNPALSLDNINFVNGK